MNIYVGNLNFKVEENDLQDVFEEFGSVNESKIIKDKFTGRSKGFGFVTMDNADEAQRAINELNGTSFHDREMVVNEARERSESNNNRRY